MTTHRIEAEGELLRDASGRWYVRTGYVARADLDERLQARPDPNADGAPVVATLFGVGPCTSWTVTDYHFC